MGDWNEDEWIDGNAPSQASQIEARLKALEEAVFGVIKPDADGWLTNGRKDDEAQRKTIMAEFGIIRIGEPKATPVRSVEELKQRGIVGIYLAQ